ncbi:MAG: beta-ketoacyl-[acyl-carrier-protein] synthase family protein [Dissulfurispiraceae bacterium]
MKRRIVITGTGIVTALGIGQEVNRAKILAGTSAIRQIKAFDAHRYRGKCGGEALEFVTADLYNIEGRRLDRASHLLIQAAREALAEADIIETIRNRAILLSLGTTLGGMRSGEIFHKEVLVKGLGRARLSLLTDYLAQCQAMNLLREFKLHGDFRIFSNACASGANAIGQAFKALQAGEYDAAICGGYDTMSEFTFAGFNALMAVSPKLCRPFDKNRDGLVLGEGAGILVLEELEHAEKRGAVIIGEIKGYGESSDGYHMTSPDPDGKGAAVAITRSLEDAGQKSVDYINAHGTGTVLNDSIEGRAISKAFGKLASDIPVSSIKPMIGHVLGAAGAVEAIASLFAIKDRVLPPNINFEMPDPDCALNIVTSAHMKCAIRTVLSNSFGFGGSNAAIILGEYR